MAGKGDKQRKVNGSKYRDNYDIIYSAISHKTWIEWAIEKEDIIIDPTGFLKMPQNQLYSFKDYSCRLKECKVKSKCKRTI